MTRQRQSVSELIALDLDRDLAMPMYRQLYLLLRQAILARRLAPGARLPSTRRLARDLGVARSTVVAAFDQLMAEGYLVGRVGAGKFRRTQSAIRATWCARRRRPGATARQPAGGG